MRYLPLAGALALAVSLLAGCSDGALTKFQSAAGNLISGLQTTQLVVAEVDKTIAAISQRLYARCGQIQAVGGAAVKVAPSCGRAAEVVYAVNAAINSLCQAPQVTDVTQALTAAANAYVDVKDQLGVTQTACKAQGG